MGISSFLHVNAKRFKSYALLFFWIWCFDIGTGKKVVDTNMIVVSQFICILKGQDSFTTLIF